MKQPHCHFTHKANRNKMLKTLSCRIPLAVLLFGALLIGCDSSDPEAEFIAPETVMAMDIPAAPFTGFDQLGRPFGPDTYTFFSLRTNQIVANTDSASTLWDIGLKGSTIIVNGGTSGPGEGGAQIIETLFEEVLVAPETGYAVDSADNFAIPSGSGNGWYNYNPQLQVLSPIPGRVLVIRCADGSYAKLRILSYYQGMPDNPSFESVSRYYTFEFVHQPDGSTRFE